MNYSLDADKARNAGKGGYISSSGKYEGVFTEAKAVTAKTGTKGIEFAFENFDGQVASFMTIYTHRSNGESIYGEDMIHAMMTCMQLRELPEIKGEYKAAEGKVIGLVLQREEYLKKDDTIGYKMNIVHFYNAGTKQMAEEILDSTDAKRLENITVSDKLLSNEPPSSMSQRPNSEKDHDFADDDIPF